MQNDGDNEDKDRDTEESDDTELFRQQMEGVTPLKDDNRVSRRTRPRPVRVRRETDGEHDGGRFSTAPATENVAEILSFARPGIQRSKLQKLKQGKLQLQDSIDLHGCHIEEARAYLLQFLDECRQNRVTLVRIVHGKGTHSKDNIPVIKAMLDRWLREAPEVLAFHSAIPNDGGSGALYVLLKKES